MNTVFEPAMVFIPEDEWAVESTRDQFLEHLLGHLQCLHELAFVRLYWTDRLEEHLWEGPQVPPWRLDRDWQIPLVPVVYHRLSQCRLLLDPIGLDGQCWIEPPMEPVAGRQAACLAFRQLMHQLVIQREQVYFCVGLRNRLGDDRPRTFSCNCHEPSLSLRALEHPDDWVRKVDWVEGKWPRGSDSEDVSRLRRAISIAGGWRPGQPEITFRYEYLFKPKFVGHVSKERALRSEILKCIVRRLQLTQAQAGKDGGLKDESVKGRAGVRRCRVTGVARIHYQYVDTGRIVFTDYFGEGQHDEGL